MLNNKLGFIGVGNMASAIIDGVLGANCVSGDSVFLYDIDEAKKQRFSSAGCNACDSEKAVLENADIAFLAVKPQNIDDVLSGVAGSLHENGVIVSIAAGISIEHIQNILGSYPVIRVMPNACMRVGLGASAVSCSSEVSDEQLEAVSEILRCCGSVEVIDESLQNSVIAVHSSSPAFIFLLAKAIVDEAEAEGIDRGSALKLFCSTLCGSAEMMLQSDESLDELISMITSKGGTTEAALRVFKEFDFYNAVREGMKACRDRAEKLGKK